MTDRCKRLPDRRNNWHSEVCKCTSSDAVRAMYSDTDELSICRLDKANCSELFTKVSKGVHRAASKRGVQLLHESRMIDVGHYSEL